MHMENIPLKMHIWWLSRGNTVRQLIARKLIDAFWRHHYLPIRPTCCYFFIHLHSTAASPMRCGSTTLEDSREILHYVIHMWLDVYSLKTTLYCCRQASLISFPFLHLGIKISKCIIRISNACMVPFLNKPETMCWSCSVWCGLIDINHIWMHLCS